MDEFDHRAFANLFDEVVRKGFGHALTSPLSEPECRHLSLLIEERTGLVVGWRSLKNYANYLLHIRPDKSENPSLTTLDTLARYVLNAPVTSEAARKRNGEPAQYWFFYREQTNGARSSASSKLQPIPKRTWPAVIILFVVLLAVTMGWLVSSGRAPERMETDFRSTDEATLRGQSWFVQHLNKRFWEQRRAAAGGLTLFTLKGDNWPQPGKTLHIQNLLLRPIHSKCFQADVYLHQFVPSGNWQQAGLLFLEDTLSQGKSIRLSLSYNSYFGGLPHPAEILVQGIASNGQQDHLEEFIHLPLFQLINPSARRVAATNLKNVAFRVEKQGHQFRFMYSVSPLDNFSFKEVGRYELAMTPRYIGLFALKGFVDTTAIIPVQVRYFRLEGMDCL